MTGLSIEQKNIDWRAAHALVEAAVNYAESLNLKINVAVVDSGGHLAAFLRMPGSAFHSVDIAIDKAYTAMSFALPTSEWGPIADSLSATGKDALLSQDRLLACGGGVPLEVDGQCIAAVGVSGASENQDEEIALHAISLVQQQS